MQPAEDTLVLTGILQTRDEEVTALYNKVAESKGCNSRAFKGLMVISLINHVSNECINSYGLTDQQRTELETEYLALADTIFEEQCS